LSIALHHIEMMTVASLSALKPGEQLPSAPFGDFTFCHSSNSNGCLTNGYLLKTRLYRKLFFYNILSLAFYYVNHLLLNYYILYNLGE